MEIPLHARLDLLYDVSHNPCKLERHRVAGEQRELFVHRKGATRAFGLQKRQRRRRRGRSSRSDPQSG